MEFETLYKLTSTGKVQMWKIEANPADDPDVQLGAAVIRTTYGLLHGKRQTAREVIREGKNLGKGNETSAVEQAGLEALSQWEKKQKRGYVTSLEDAEQQKVNKDFVAGGISPMLAHDYQKQGHKIMFPAFTQPKLDGHRCIAHIDGDDVALWSRTQKRINSLPHIEKALKGLFGYMLGVHVDGELYNHE
jgi:ATP-dependent DNA ligase